MNIQYKLHPQFFFFQKIDQVASNAIDQNLQQNLAHTIIKMRINWIKKIYINWQSGLKKQSERFSVMKKNKKVKKIENVDESYDW